MLEVSHGVEWIAAGRYSDMAENSTRRVMLRETYVCLYRVDGVIHASADRCTHGDASLSEGFLLGNEIECPLHQGRFDIRNGRAVGLPCKVDLKTYAVRRDGDEIQVALEAPDGGASPGAGTPDPAAIHS